MFYSPEFFGKTGKATYYEINAAAPIPNSKFSVSGALGHQQVKGPADYTTWNAGIGFALNDHIGLDLRYWDTDEHSLGKIYDSRVVAGVKAASKETFPCSPKLARPSSPRSSSPCCSGSAIRCW